MTIKVPLDTIAIISYDKTFQNKESIDSLFSSLKGAVKRDWFVKHAYSCLPLNIGNQYGFVVKSLYDLEIEWNGGDDLSDISIHFHAGHNPLQLISSHFGMGTVTIQTPFSLRTPRDINIMTINPPNYFIDGIHYMTGVIEADNLRRDFTFNIRVTRKNYPIHISRGDILGCFIPYPRGFIDSFSLADANDIFSDDEIKIERQCSIDFATERSTDDRLKPNGNGRRYFNGEDVYGNKFYHHQKRLDGNQ